MYYGEGRQDLVRPVILTDGFAGVPSNLDVLYDGLNRGAYPFITELTNRGHDFILVGYNDRTASILANAEVVKSCIWRAISERRGDIPLAVGGFSMGGLVTRYALAKLEFDGIDHQTSTYISYDSPHRGAWIPISLQSLAHYLKDQDSSLSDMINSPAARQLLWRHIENLGDEPAEDPLRADFLGKLRDVGWWPAGYGDRGGFVKIGVANGSGTGVGNGNPAGEVALHVTKLGGALNLTKLYLQDNGDPQLGAQFPRVLQLPLKIYTHGYPQLDSAPGGTLRSFGIAADALKDAGQPAESDYPTVNFVPSVSAVAIRDIDNQADLYTDISTLPPRASELDEFLCSSANEEHTVITEELCTWILDRLPQK